MITTTHNKEGKLRKPFVIVKDKSYVNHPEGRWGVWFFLRAVIHGNKKSFKYAELRHSGYPIRFKTQEEAIEYAYYKLGM